MRPFWFDKKNVRLPVNSQEVIAGTHKELKCANEYRQRHKAGKGIGLTHVAQGDIVLEPQDFPS